MIGRGATAGQAHQRAAVLLLAVTTDVSLAPVVAGMDTLYGFYHQPRFGKPALALDLMELRPLVAGSVVITPLLVLGRSALPVNRGPVAL